MTKKDNPELTKKAAKPRPAKTKRQIEKEQIAKANRAMEKAWDLIYERWDKNV